MTITFGIDGLDELSNLEEEFAAASQEVQAAIDRGTRKSAHDLRDMIVYELRRSDIRRRDRDGESIYDSFRVQKVGDAYQIYSTADYAEYLEFGTRPYTIRRSDGSPLRFVTESGEVVYTTEVNHPGIRARGFWRRAINRFEADDIYSENLSEEIQKVIERI